MNLRYSFFLICSCWMLIMIGISQFAYSQSNLSQTNLQYLYNPESPVSFDSRVVMGNAEGTVFLKISDRSESNLSLRYQIKEAYKAEEILSEGPIEVGQKLKEEGPAAYYQFEIAVPENARYLFVFAETTANGSPISLRYDIPLKTEQSFPATDLVVMRADEDIPVFSNVITPQDKSRVISFYNQADTVFAYYYSYDFTPNPPPMATRGSEASQTMSIDSLFSIAVNDTFSLNSQGLYFIQADTTSLSGVSFRVENPYFPKLVYVEDIIEPLRYISTSEEMEVLESSQDTKEQLDRYLMKVTRSQNRAKDFMRKYFKQVKEANRLFTTYKEGWKTGQGMVYTLYGTPDQVFRDNEREVWVYNADQDLVDLSFTFSNIKNLYTNNHYNLIPDEDYKKFWFRNIDLWRKGMKILD